MAMPFNLGSLFRNTQQVQLAPGQQQQMPQQPQGQQQAPQGQQQQPQGTPGSSMQQKQPGANGQPQQPADQQQPGQGSPLDDFSALWKTDPTKSGNQPPADPWSEPLFATDPAKIREAAGKMDFLSQIPQDLMQKAMSGNDPQSFMQVINAVAQNALAASLQIGTATTEHAGKTIGERFNKSLPGRFKDLQLEGSTPSDERLSHPAVQPMLKFARDQIKMQNPDLPPQQIQAQAERYLLAMMQGGSDTQALGASGGQGGSQDNFNWGSWINSSAPNS